FQSLLFGEHPLCLYRRHAYHSKHHGENVFHHCSFVLGSLIFRCISFINLAFTRSECSTCNTCCLPPFFSKISITRTLSSVMVNWSSRNTFWSVVLPVISPSVLYVRNGFIAFSCTTVRLATFLSTTLKFTKSMLNGTLLLLRSSVWK